MPRHTGFILFIGFALFLLFCGRVRIAPPDLAFYYAVPQSILNDADFQFANEYQSFPFAMHELYLTSQNFPANDWPPGTGLCWLPFLLLAKMLCFVTGIPYENGSGWFAKWVVTYSATLLFGFGAVWLTWKWCLLEGLPKDAIRWSIALYMVGSTFTYHLYVNSADSHMPSAFFAVLLLYTWRKMNDAPAYHQAIIMGIIAGMGALVRPHNALILLIPLLYDGYVLIQQKQWKNYILNCVMMLLAFFITFSPQLMLWKTLYGSWIYAPRSGDVLWLHPQWYNTLFSHYHGMLSWSPLFALGILGLFLSRKGGLFAVPFLLQLYLVSCHIAWWAGGSFGNRRMIGCVPLLIFGLAYLLQYLPKLWLKIVACVCALWTFLLMLAETGGTLPLSRPLSWQEIMDAISNGFLPGILFHVSLPQWQEHTPARFTGWFVVTLLFLWIGWVVSKYQWTSKTIFISSSGIVLIIVLLCGISAWRSKPLSSDQASSYIPYDRFNWEVYYEAAFFHLNQNQVDYALQKYIAAFALDPRHPNTMRYMALIWKTYYCERLAFHYSRAAMMYGYRRQDFFIFFESQLTDMLTTDAYPKHILLNERGIVRTIMNRYFEAAADFESALEIHPGYEKAINNIEALEQWKRGTQARLDWE